MLTTESIAQSLGGTSPTNGWDAVFAMNLKQVNALFFQQFLQVGPTRTQTRLRCALSDESAMWILDAQLGPPELSLKPGETKATVEMELIAGALITIDPNSLVIVNAAWLRPNESNLSGSLELAKVKGEVNRVGAVVMDLGATAYSPTIGGVDPRSVLNTNIGEAARTFFKDNAVSYTLGIIGNDAVAPSLTPTTFLITTQKHPTQPDSCVLVLIQTNGQAGTVGPLPAYPIPDKFGVALLIAEPALFKALGDDLTRSFAPFGTKFSAQGGSNGWSTVGSGGAINCGSYGRQYDCNHENEWDRSDKMPWTSDGNGNLNSVDFGMDGFTVSGANGQLVATWTNKHSQYVSEIYRNHIGISLCAVRSNISTVQGDFKVSGTPTVDPGSSKVSFTFSNPVVLVKIIDTPSFWDRLWGGVSITGNITAAIQTNLLATLKSFTVLTIDAFRLKCLLFQTPDTVQLTEAALPKGVYLTGIAAMPISITPATTTVKPGGTVQFQATGFSSSDILWEIRPADCGSINRTTGLYTAPSSLSSAEVVVVVAIEKSKPQVVGRAMVLVYQSPAASGVAVLPSRSLVTAGHHVTLFTSDAAGKPLSVNWTLSPNTGSIRQGLKQGEYIYTAPPIISAVAEVTAKAVDVANSALTGSAVIQLTPSTTIAVTPAQASVKLGGKVALTAGSRDPKLRWVVYPSGSGKIEFDLNNPAAATYSAPASITNGSLVNVMAYLVDGQAAGLGFASITLTS